MRCAGLPVFLIGLPINFADCLIGSPVTGHCTAQDPGVQMLVDPFNGGEICFLEDTEEKLNKLLSPKKVRAGRR